MSKISQLVRDQQQHHNSIGPIKFGSQRGAALAPNNASFPPHISSSTGTGANLNITSHFPLSASHGLKVGFLASEVWCCRVVKSSAGTCCPCRSRALRVELAAAGSERGGGVKTLPLSCCRPVCSLGRRFGLGAQPSSSDRQQLFRSVFEEALQQSTLPPEHHQNEGQKNGTAEMYRCFFMGYYLQIGQSSVAVTQSRSCGAQCSCCSSIEAKRRCITYNHQYVACFRILALNIAFADILFVFWRGNVPRNFNIQHSLSGLIHHLQVSHPRLLSKSHHCQKVYGTNTACDAIMHYLSKHLLYLECHALLFTNMFHRDITGLSACTFIKVIASSNLATKRTVEKCVPTSNRGPSRSRYPFNSRQNGQK